MSTQESKTGHFTLMIKWRKAVCPLILQAEICDSFLLVKWFTQFINNLNCCYCFRTLLYKSWKCADHLCINGGINDNIEVRIVSAVFDPVLLLSPQASEGGASRCSGRQIQRVWWWRVWHFPQRPGGHVPHMEGQEVRAHRRIKNPWTFFMYLHIYLIHVPVKSCSKCLIKAKQDIQMLLSLCAMLLWKTIKPFTYCSVHFFRWFCQGFFALFLTILFFFPTFF